MNVLFFFRSRRIGNELIFIFNNKNNILGDGSSVGGDSGPEIGALFGDWSSDGGSLHFSLVVDDNSCVILEVDEGTVLSAELLALSDNDSLKN